ncbi:MAG: hypothetical protein RRY07_09010 [Bacteroidaceae bacterium]
MAQRGEPDYSSFFLFLVLARALPEAIQWCPHFLFLALMPDVVVGEACNVGGMSVVLYDTKMEKGASLEPLSVLMKGESLPAGTTFVGAPSQRI